MAARAGIRFSTRGAGRTIGKVQGVGTAFGGLGKSSKSASFGIGQVAYRLYNTLARISMVRRGVSGMSREVKGAENVWRGWGRAMGGPFTSVLAGVSKKFAEVRRTVAFYILAAKDYARWGKKITGVGKAVPKGVPAKEVGKAVDGAPPVKPPPPGIIAKFGRLGGVYRVVATAAKVLTGAVIGLTVALTALYTYITYKTARMALGVVKGFMSIRETFRKYEISLGGIIRNTAATAKIMKFATKYAAEYPAMFEDVIDAFRGLASMPTLKPLFRKADYDDLKGIMDIVQGLATLKPQQGVQGAMMALREALSGQMRSLRMRFEVNVREMADAAGFSFGEITHDANKALIAIRKFVELNVPAEAMASMAKTIEVQWGNVYDKYRTFVNEMMKSTGAYWAVVKALEHLNEWFEKVFAAPEVIGFAQKIGNALREIVNIFEAAMTGFDWGGYLKRGDLVGAVRDLCDRIRVLFAVLWEEFGGEAKKTVKTVVALLKDVLKPAFAVIATSFWEILKSAAWDAGGIAVRLFGKAFLSGVPFIHHGMRDMLAKAVLGSMEGTKLDKPFDYGEQKLKIAADYWKQKLETAADYLGQKLKFLDKLPGRKIPEVPEIKKPEPVFYKMPREKREEGIERFAVATDPLKQVALLKDRLRRGAKDIRGKLLVSKPEPVETGEDVPLKIDKKALEALKKQEKIKKAIAKTEHKIYTLKKGGGRNIQQFIDFEIQLLNLVVEKYKAEEQLIGIAKQQKENEKDIADLKEYGNKELSKITILEKDSLKLTKEKAKAEQQMVEADSDQKKVKEEIFALETQINKKQAEIADIREGNIRGINAIIKLETRSIDLAKKKLDTEQEIARAVERQLKTKSKIQMMEMTIGGLGKIGLGVIDRTKSMFATFRNWLEKEQAKPIGGPQMLTLDKKGRVVSGVPTGGWVGPVPGQMWSEEAAAAARRPGEARMPGMGMTWREGIAKSLEPATQGIPQFFLKLEEILREKLGRPDLSMPVQKSLLERLYKLNVEQFRMATGPAKGVQFLEANKFMEKLMSVENQLQEEQLQLTKGQAKNIESIAVGIKSANTWLSEINERISNPVLQPSASRSAPSPANPLTQYEWEYAQ